MQWGFTVEGKKGPPIINARSESVMERPMFKTAILRHRCLIPCNGFYEWNAKKEKFFYHSPGRGMMLLAGIWRMERGARLPRFTILTRDAVGDMLDIHDRMPVVVPRELADTWLLEASKIEEVLGQAVTELSISYLRQAGLIERVGSAKSGHWVVRQGHLRHQSQMERSMVALPLVLFLLRFYLEVVLVQQCPVAGHISCCHRDAPKIRFFTDLHHWPHCLHIDV